MANCRAIGGGNPSGMINYSNEEQIIGTWTDGSPVYRKVYHPNVTTSTATRIDATLTTANVKCINMYGNFIDGSSQNSSADFHYWSGSTDIGYTCIINSNGLDVVVFNNHSWTIRELVVEYIKI